MKDRGKNSQLPSIKQPATYIIPRDILDITPEIQVRDSISQSGYMLSSYNRSLPPDVYFNVSPDGVLTIKFPFLNGAMSTNQCKRLTDVLNQINSRNDVKVIVLAGDEAAWSNGINLNTIDASRDPENESWENINAINDFVKAIFWWSKIS